MLSNILRRPDQHSESQQCLWRYELLGRSRVQRRARIVVTLPAEQITHGVAETRTRPFGGTREARLARVQRET